MREARSGAAGAREIDRASEPAGVAAGGGNGDAAVSHSACNSVKRPVPWPGGWPSISAAVPRTRARRTDPATSAVSRLPALAVASSRRAPDCAGAARPIAMTATSAQAAAIRRNDDIAASI